MGYSYIFSWAQDSNGHLVHVDDVPRGKDCGCICPHCHEPLLARHGDEREHGFAHHSETRGANLKICYMVIMYKLAEHIILTHKKIHAPSYYGIFPEMDIEFAEVKIDGQYEREDKQPDVLATTADGKQYIIEFTFAYKVQHIRPLDYQNQSCIEIDLSNQTLDSLEEFLLKKSDDRKWLNNQNYFSAIEPRYKKAKKEVTIVGDEECKGCILKQSCCCVRGSNGIDPLVIENNGRTYRLCKVEQYSIGLQKKIQEEEERWLEEQKKKKRAELARLENIRRQQEMREKQSQNRVAKDANIDPSAVSCFDCANNLKEQNRNGYANCGMYGWLNKPQNTPSETAKTCGCFTPIKSQ